MFRAMTIPEQYRPALDALVDGLLADLHWKTSLESSADTPADLAVSAVLVLTGPVPPLFVQPWSDDETLAMGAHIFTDEILVTVRVDGPAAAAGASSAIAVPLVVESLEVSSSASPWQGPYGSAPQWPGSLAATVRIGGVADPITVPSRPIRNPDHRANVQTLVEHLAARVRASGRPTVQASDT